MTRYISIFYFLFLIFTFLVPKNVLAQTPTPTIQDQFGPNFTGVIKRGDHDFVLPKTGLNPLIWIFTTLVPLGYKLKNYHKVTRDNTPEQLWNKREFSRVNDDSSEKHF